MADTWLASFARLCSGREDLLGVFAPDNDDCWLRDLLVLSPDFHTLHGHAAIGAHLREDARSAALHNFRLDSAQAEPADEQSFVLLFSFHIAKPSSVDATGRGCARLARQHDGQWRALAVLLVLHDFVGYEEDVGRARNDAEQMWDDAWEAAQSSIQDDLAVLVVGAGHNGLMTAARLKQMGIKTLVIDRSAVGDSWKNRYSSLKLHTTILMNSFPYQSYSQTWPKYLPKGKMARFLRTYGEAQDLIVWESTELLSDPRPVYNEEAGTWTVHVRRDAETLVLRPRHIVLAMGLVSSPRRLEIPGLKDFGGVVLHSSEHTDGAAWKGSKVVIVGACNSSADIALDAVRSGAAEITIVQRSETTVMSMQSIETFMFAPLFPDNSPLSIAQHDLINNSLPHAAIIRMLRGGVSAQAQEMDRAMLDALAAAGFKTRDTPLYELLLSRGGGYILDQGAVQHIVSGRIKVKHGLEVAQLEPRTVILTDGSRLDADVLVLAIGYDGIHSAVRTMFGPELIDQTTDVWGLDEQGEIQGVFRPSGHKGLWYAAGDFSHARFMGRLLALQILAAELQRRGA